MTKEQIERIVVSFESIAKSLECLNEAAKRAGTRYWPEPGPQKEVIISRVQTEEDKAKERRGDINIPIEQWLTNLRQTDDDDEEEYVGERVREWRRTHPEEGKKTKVSDASTETVSVGEQDTASVEEVEGKAGSISIVATDNTNVEKKSQRRTKNRS